MVYRVVQVYFLVDHLLVILSIIEREVLKSPLLLNYLFFPSILEVLFHVFWNSDVIYVYNCSIFLMGSPFYHYKMSFFVSSNKKIYFCVACISIAVPALFCLLFTWNIFYLFPFNLFVFLNMIGSISFCRHTSVGSFF